VRYADLSEELATILGSASAGLLVQTEDQLQLEVHESTLSMAEELFSRTLNAETEATDFPTIFIPFLHLMSKRKVDENRPTPDRETFGGASSTTLLDGCHGLHRLRLYQARHLGWLSCGSKSRHAWGWAEHLNIAPKVVRSGEVYSGSPESPMRLDVEARRSDRFGRIV